MAQFFLTSGEHTVLAWFLSILNISISTGYLILAVIMVRFIFRRAPKNMRCFLWLLVGIRLLCPVSIESAFSLIPSGSFTDNTIAYDTLSAVDTENETVDAVTGKYFSSQFTPQKSKDKPIQTVKVLIADIWIIGILIMIIYLLSSWISIKRKVQTAIPFMAKTDYGNNMVYQCDAINTPFLFGLFHPKIYIPNGIARQNLSYIIMHENAHEQRKDYLIKLVAYLILSVYWFNPLIWVAYILLCRDIELACDERVIRQLEQDSRVAYSEALLSCAVSHGRNITCPVAFGEIDVKNRIKNILQYRKPTFWIIILAIIACVIVGMCFMTKPLDKTEFPQNNDIYSETADFTEKWATAFCNRDGEIILSMVDEKLSDKLEEDGLLVKGQDINGNNYTDFGWSSPWPWSEDSGMPNYRVVHITENTADILYYAHVSDPHVTVWHEQLQYQKQNEKYVIVDENLEIMDNISTAEEFYTAYPNGMINGTPMDYENGNTSGETLNRNAKTNSDMQAYESLFNPATAAVYLLNILNDPAKVEVIVTQTSQKDKTDITFLFHEDESRADVTMIQPYGEDGIWIPQNAETFSSTAK